MTWHWAICFSVLVASTYGANVTGTILLADTSHAKKQGTIDSPTVVWLEPLDTSTYEPNAATKLQMVQKNKTFQPHVLAVPVGARVAFPNFDPIFHNAFSNYDGQIFDIGLYPPGSTRNVRFSREGVVRIFCNIHSAMSAIIVVLRTPYYAVSQRDGSFCIGSVPEANYRLKLYQEMATEQTLSNLSRTLTVSTNDLELGNIVISSDGYIAISHTNKYGKPYSPTADATAYPGARQ